MSIPSPVHERFFLNCFYRGAETGANSSCGRAYDPDARRWTKPWGRVDTTTQHPAVSLARGRWLRVARPAGPGIAGSSLASKHLVAKRCRVRLNRGMRYGAFFDRA